MQARIHQLCILNNSGWSTAQLLRRCLARNLLTRIHEHSSSTTLGKSAEDLLHLVSAKCCFDCPSQGYWEERQDTHHSQQTHETATYPE